MMLGNQKRKLQLKKISDQVLVITGASSGIGLATAKLAVESGASVVMCARDLTGLSELSKEFSIGAGAGRVVLFEADVTSDLAMRALAEIAIAEFGRIDTWVNNAGTSIYGKLTDVPLEESRRLFDVNFWGVVYGSQAAIPYLREAGGAIINVGSTLSDRVIPLQGMYCASKHAVKAYTDALRMELEADDAKISVTLVKPAAIDTPYPEHAVNHMEAPPTHQGPVYAPEVVARAILDCAQNPQRDLYVGGAAKIYSLLETYLPRMTDYIMEKTMMEEGQSDPSLPNDRQNEGLFEPRGRRGKIHGDYAGRVRRNSSYTTASLHPVTTALIATGIGLAAAGGIAIWRSRARNLRLNFAADETASNFAAANPVVREKSRNNDADVSDRVSDATAETASGSEPNSGTPELH